MESVQLDMDEIFDMEEGDDNEDNFPSALPDLPEELAPLEDGGGDIAPTQDAENAEVLAKLKGMKGAGKKVVRKPQPKLDAARLTGERGIAMLPRVFKDIKFKGRGHEAEDLRITMKYLEHWAHRLFPMMPFDDVIERIEKLGSKKEVQTCIKKMRLDIPVLKEDFVEEKEEEDPQSPIRGNLGDMDGEEAFDEMMREEQEQRLQSQQTPTPARLDTPSAPLAAPVTPVATPVTSLATPGITVPKGLTPEQMEKIERNKRLAMEKRAARLAAQQRTGPSAQHSGLTTPTANASTDATKETAQDVQKNYTSLSQSSSSESAVPVSANRELSVPQGEGSQGLNDSQTSQTSPSDAKNPEKMDVLEADETVDAVGPNKTVPKAGSVLMESADTADLVLYCEPTQQGEGSLITSDTKNSQTAVSETNTTVPPDQADQNQSVFDAVAEQMECTDTTAESAELVLYCETSPTQGSEKTSTGNKEPSQVMQLKDTEESQSGSLDEPCDVAVSLTNSDEDKCTYETKNDSAVGNQNKGEGCVTNTDGEKQPANRYTEPDSELGLTGTPDGADKPEAQSPHAVDSLGTLQKKNVSESLDS